MFGDATFLLHDADINSLHFSLINKLRCVREKVNATYVCGKNKDLSAILDTLCHKINKLDGKNIISVVGSGSIDGYFLDGK